MIRAIDRSRKNNPGALSLHLMALTGLLFVVVFCYLPMAGIVIAFQKFVPARGLFGRQSWVGLDNFVYLMEMPNTFRVIWNTLSISLMKMIFGTFTPVLVALLLNQVRNLTAKRTIQTLIYLPYFLSWVILAGIFLDIFSPTNGMVNRVVEFFGGEPIFFLGDKRWFPATLVITDTWKNYGYTTIIYLAAISGIDPNLYEACMIDGAKTLKQIWYVTLPGIRSIVVLMALLSLGNILNAGFEQVFSLYSPQVYETGDIIDTLVYRLGLMNAQYGVATAVGLFKSVVSMLLISLSYFLSYRWTGYRIF